MRATGVSGHGAYIGSLRAMTAEQRLEVAFEVTEFTRDLFLCGLRSRFPEKSEDEIQRLFLERIDLCHNQSY